MQIPQNVHGQLSTPAEQARFALRATAQAHPAWSQGRKDALQGLAPRELFDPAEAYHHAMGYHHGE